MKRIIRRVRGNTLVRMARSVDANATGDYKVRKIRAKDLRHLYYLMSFSAIIRGTDYLFQQASTRPVSPTLALTESVLQLPVWGWGYITAALLLIASIKFRKIFPGAIAHVVLATLYCMTAIITLQTTLPEFDNYRGALPLLILAYLHYKGVVLLGFPFRKNSHGEVVYPKDWEVGR